MCMHMYVHVYAYRSVYVHVFIYMCVYDAATRGARGSMCVYVYILHMHMPE